MGSRVLQVVGPAAGGMARHVEELSARLKNRGWQVEVMGLSPALGRSMRRADLVHAHGLTAGWRSSLAPRRPPLVVTVHNLVLASTHGRARYWQLPLQQWLPRRVDRVIATSSEIQRVLSAANVTTVWPVGPPPVPQRSKDEVRADLGLTGNQRLVVALGRLHRQKGFDILIDAAARLPDGGWRLAIVGDGPERVQLRQQLEAAGLSDRVQLAPATSDPAGLLAAADLVVCSSRWESGPLVVGEALWLKRPVVSTAVGFVPELFGSGTPLVPIDDAAALAEAIGAGLQRPTVDPAAVARARTLLNPEALTAAVEAVYQAMLDDR